MKKGNELHFIRKGFLVTFLSFFLVMTAVLAIDGLAIVGHALNQGTITVSSAMIRKEPTTDSEAIGSATQNTTVTVTGQIKGTDGFIWYQVQKDAQTLGYIRSDLVKITDGGTPPTLTSAGIGQNPASPSAEIVEVTPVSGAVTGAQSVRIKAEPNSNGQLVKTVESGLVLTVTGYSTDSEGYTWYQVKYLSNNEEVSGYIRSDYVTLSGSLVPVSQGGNTTEPSEPSTAPSEEPQPEHNDYEVTYENDIYYLVDNTTSYRYPIDKIFDTNKTNNELYDKEVKRGKNLQKIITLLIIVIIAMAAVIALGYIKLKEQRDEMDMMRASEKNGAGRRSADRPQSGRGTQGSRPVQASRPAQGGNRLPASSAQKQGQNGAAGKQTAPAKKPASPQSQQTKPASGQGEQKAQPKKPRNIMDDNDEFEFEFLNSNNWDEDK